MNWLLPLCDHATFSSSSSSAMDAGIEKRWTDVAAVEMLYELSASEAVSNSDLQGDPLMAAKFEQRALRGSVASVDAGKEQGR